MCMSFMTVNKTQTSSFKKNLGKAIWKVYHTNLRFMAFLLVLQCSFLNKLILSYISDNQQECTTYSSKEQKTAMVLPIVSTTDRTEITVVPVQIANDNSNQLLKIVYNQTVKEVRMFFIRRVKIETLHCIFFYRYKKTNLISSPDDCSNIVLNTLLLLLHQVQ